MAKLTYEECLEENKKLRKRLDTDSVEDTVARIDREEKIIALLHEEREALADLKSVHDAQFRAESQRSEATLLIISPPRLLESMTNGRKPHGGCF